MAEQNRLTNLDEAGTSVWLDYIRRKLVASGELQHMVDDDGLRGMTSNPTIFGKAIAGSTEYDTQIHDLVAEGRTPLEIFQIIATDDIRDACDVIRSTYDQLKGYDGYVSVEVSPAAADDTQRTLDEAHELWKLVDRPNVMIKVPGTEAGLPAIEELISEGININITLLFDVENYALVAERYIRGLERRLESRQPINHIASVASFFVSRVDSAVDKQLQAMIDATSDQNEQQLLAQLQGKAAIANAKIAYQRFQETFAGPRWDKLAAEGAMVQRPLWASTSTKNPDYRDVMYIEQLIGPSTVNTMPQATMNAFKDHGKVAPTLVEDVPGAHRIVEELGALGIDVAAVTKQLQIDGVRLFTESFDELMDCIDAERTAITMSIERSESASLGEYEATVEKELLKLTDDQFVRMLWEKDGSLWSDDASEQESIKQALGWLNIVETMRDQVPDIEAFAREIKSDGFTDAVVLGMGGSSLCPDVMRETFGVAPGFPKLWVLDTTDTAAVEHLSSQVDLSKSLFIVSSKSGSTAEPNAFYHYFWGMVAAAGVDNPGQHFIAITDPGTSLETEAKGHNFRRVFPGVPDIGGRYSALSNFGMVPAAVMGVDIRELLSRAKTMAHATQPCVGPTENPGVQLGTILGVLASRGRDKLTLCPSSEIQAFGWWVEQLVAESTGKSGIGIVPIEGEKLGDPHVYGNDRVFVSLRMRGSNHGDGDETERRLGLLQKAGHPVVTLELTDRLDLGGEFFRWEIATAAAGSILRINAFNQPNVQESKDNTNRLLAGFEKDGRLPEPEVSRAANGIAISGGDGDAADPGACITGFLNQHVRAGSYVAFMAYLEPSSEHAALLDRMRLATRDRFTVATTLGWGPRFLHSTGQLHKGGPAEGVFIQIVGQDQSDVAIENEKFSFGTLIAAQSLGDYQALQKHQRPVLRIDLGSDVDGGLRLLASALAGAAV